MKKMKICMVAAGVVPPKNCGGTEREVNWLEKELKQPELLS